MSERSNTHSLNTALCDMASNSFLQRLVSLHMPTCLVCSPIAAQTHHELIRQPAQLVLLSPHCECLLGPHNRRRPLLLRHAEEPLLLSVAVLLACSTCTCRQPAVQICTGLSFTMSTPALPSGISFEPNSNPLLSCHAFQPSHCPGHRHSPEQSSPILRGRHNQLCPCRGRRSVTLLGEEADENQTLGR